MICSMTGFARAEAQHPWGRLTWELRAVNHRYFDITLKMPEELRAIENEIRQRAGARVLRGKVEAALRLSRETAEAPPLQLDSARLQELRKALDVVAAALPSAAAPDPVRVLGWPGVVRTEASDSAPMQVAALELFEVALLEFGSTREREGKGIASHLEQRCDAIAAHAKAVRERMPLVQGQWLEKLKARCLDLGVAVEPGRLEQEVVLVAQRLDVDEELSRLGAHLDEVRQSLRRGEAVGRRLDFLMQELNREANTLSSKSQDAETTRLAVEIKVAIEQMREQVQNIE